LTVCISYRCFATDSQTLFADSVPVFIKFFSCQLKLSVADFGIDCEAKQIMLLLVNSMIKISVTAWFAFPPQLILTNPAEEHRQGFIGATLAQRMKTVPGQLLWEIWEIMKQNNSFLVKQNNKNSTKVQFSEDTNHLYHFTHLSFQVNHITMFFLIALWQANHITLFFFQPENKTRCSHTMGN